MPSNSILRFAPVRGGAPQVLGLAPASGVPQWGGPISWPLAPLGAILRRLILPAQQQLQMHVHVPVRFLPSSGCSAPKQGEWPVVSGVQSYQLSELGLPLLAGLIASRNMERSGSTLAPRVSFVSPRIHRYSCCCPASFVWHLFLGMPSPPRRTPRSLVQFTWQFFHHRSTQIKYEIFAILDFDTEFCRTIWVLPGLCCRSNFPETSRRIHFEVDCLAVPPHAHRACDSILLSTLGSAAEAFHSNCYISIACILERSSILDSIL